MIRKFALNRTKIIVLLSSFVLILSLVPTTQAANEMTTILPSIPPTVNGQAINDSYAQYPLQAATEMTAVLPTFPITVNGQVIDNNSAQYPVFVYQNIAYVPMTYHFARFLGIVTYWDGAANTFSMRGSSIRGNYVPDTGYTHYSNTLPITKLSCNIAINGVTIPFQELQGDQYPLVIYNGIIYFPLTYSHKQNFKWESSWDPVNGLVLNLNRNITQEFLDWETTFAGTPLA